MIHSINSDPQCCHCNYGIQLDTNGGKCSINCSYCWAKDVESKSISDEEVDVFLRKLLNREISHPAHKVIENKIPIRLGYLSDPFSSQEMQTQATLKTLKVLREFEYPVVIVTKSDQIASDEYLKYLDPKLCAVQISLSSTDDKIAQIIEPGAVSPTNRLAAISKISGEGHYTTVRLNPLFPIFPDGYFSQNLKSEKQLKVFSFEMIEEIADSNCHQIVAGMGHFSKSSLETLSQKLEVNLFDFFKTSSHGRFVYSQEEIEHYYKKVEGFCTQFGMNYSSCYLGTGLNSYGYSNDFDCCNLSNNIDGFNQTSLDIGLYDHISIASPEDRFIDKISKYLIHKLVKKISEK